MVLNNVHIAGAHKANPYEKGTESLASPHSNALKGSHKANPYEKGTESRAAERHRDSSYPAHKANPYEKGTESLVNTAQSFASFSRLTKLIPMKRELKGPYTIVPSLAWMFSQS